MLWAHISHLSYDDDKSTTSVGEILHAALGSRLYTLAGFALGGATVMLFNDTTDDVGYALVGGPGAAPLEKHLNARCRPACFLDMRGTTDAWFLDLQPVWVEAHRARMSLAKNFDGVFWVARVHAPTIPLGWWLLSAIHYKWQLAGLGGAMLAGALWLIARRTLRRRG